jgi:hypothetical protein
MKKRTLHAEIVSKLREHGYSVYGKNFLKIKTPGWRYQLRIEEGEIELEPQNTSKTYKRLYLRVTEALMEVQNAP